MPVVLAHGASAPLLSVHRGEILPFPCPLHGEWGKDGPWVVGSLTSLRLGAVLNLTSVYSLLPCCAWTPVVFTHGAMVPLQSIHRGKNLSSIPLPSAWGMEKDGPRVVGSLTWLRLGAVLNPMTCMVTCCVDAWGYGSIALNTQGKSFFHTLALGMGNGDGWTQGSR